MSKRTKLVGAFMAGVFLMGLGGGIAFAEYSAFQYGGEKTFGDARMTTDSFEETIYEEKGPIHVYYYHGGEAVLEEDGSLADDEIVFEVTYNKDMIRPYISQRREESGEDMITSFRIYTDGNVDLSLIMKMKEEILEGLKKKEVYSYSMEDSGVTGCTIKVSPANLERTRILR